MQIVTPDKDTCERLVLDNANDFEALFTIDLADRRNNKMVGILENAITEIQR